MLAAVKNTPMFDLGYGLPIPHYFPEFAGEIDKHVRRHKVDI